MGYNFRLSEINCALGIAQMKRIHEILQKREQAASLYNTRLSNWPEVRIPSTVSGVKRSWFIYVITLADRYFSKERDIIIREMRDRGINCGRYFTPIHLQPFYVKMFGYRKCDFPVTESVSERTIALPFYNNLTESQVDTVVFNLKEVVASI